MYCEWYGICDLVVDVCVDYGGVNVVHICLNFGAVNVCGVVCVCMLR